MEEYKLIQSITSCNNILKDNNSTFHLKLGTRLRKRLLTRKLSKLKTSQVK